MTVLENEIIIYDKEIDRDKLNSDDHMYLCAGINVRQIKLPSSTEKIWSFPNNERVLNIFKSIGVKEEI